MTPVAWAVDVVIRGYQLLLRPALPNVCRFEPSCSAYARQALAAHGLGRGLGLALWRVLRCHPFHPGGYDPPPAANRQAPARAARPGG
jgi:hypothetical protein